jgi:hypothetical protein
LWSDRALARSLGARGAKGVRLHYSIQRSTDRLLEVYTAMTTREAPHARSLTPR